MDAVIRHRLDLRLRLTDTATGRALEQAGIAFLMDGEPVLPLFKGDGDYVFLGTGRKDFRLMIRAPGFEAQEAEVIYGSLDESMPSLELHLVPGRNYRSPVPLHSMEGTLEGLGELDAVKLGDGPCQIKEFDQRKRVMTIFNPHRLELSMLFYAVVNPDSMYYEPFAVEEILTEETLRIDHKLVRPYAIHFPVSRRVFGNVGKAGDYTLRVRNDTRDSRWVVRYTTKEGEHFQLVDFTCRETAVLNPKLALPAPSAEEEV